MDKKAQGMSMNIIIIAALAVMVLLLVGSFMTGGFRALTGKITSFVSSGPSAETTSEVAGCDTACTTWKSTGCPYDAAAPGSAQQDVIDRCGPITAGTATAGKITYTAGACTCTVTEGGTSWGN